MCLILFAWRAHPQYRLVVAANRDEFHDRPAAAAGFWAEEPDLLAGRDLQAGGTWLGVTRSGRFAAVTNYREPLAPEAPLERSRGDLVRNYLAGVAEPMRQAREVQEHGQAYRGFNLLLGTRQALVLVSNRMEAPADVAAGCHGLSNHLLNTEWPKVTAGKARLRELLDQDRVEAEALLELLGDRAAAPGEMPLVPGDGAFRRHLMDHGFIVSPAYGTRSSTVLLVEQGGRMEFIERSFAPDGSETGTSRFLL
ncbi:MAG: NRDE family protein [Lysobacterales bacterium]